jgi:hypothetical protein
LAKDIQAYGARFYYTILALSEIDLPSARRELGYAAPACEWVLKRREGDDTVLRLCRDIAHRALSRRA